MAIMKSGFDTTKFFTTLLLIFIVIQAGLWIVSQYVQEVQFIKMGWILFMFLGISAITSIFVLGRRLGNLRKEDLVFVFIQFLAIVGLFLFLPKYIPQIFSSYSLEISEGIRETAGSIISAIGLGIGN